MMEEEEEAVGQKKMEMKFNTDCVYMRPKKASLLGYGSYLIIQRLM